MAVTAAAPWTSPSPPLTVPATAPSTSTMKRVRSTTLRRQVASSNPASLSYVEPNA